MALTTKIEWCDSTLNLSMGCDGCELRNAAAGITHCYAGSLTDRYGGRKGYPSRFEEPTLFEDRIEQALRWSDLTGIDRPDKPWLNGMPRLIFVGDMGDTFTESLPVDWIIPHIQRMADSPHQYLMLTKRPGRMAEASSQSPFPPNVWLGTSITSQSTYGRLEQLMDVYGGGPRFVSAEPLLGHLSLCCCKWRAADSEWDEHDIRCVLPHVDWVITGGESGVGARPMDPEWPRLLRDQCVSSRVPFFFKQWGGVHKSPNGRKLDGREWNQMPVIFPAGIDA